MVMEDIIVTSVIDLYKKLPKTGKPSVNEWTVISAIVGVFYNKDVKVLSLGTGSKCIGKLSMSLKGDILNDSHAEVIARRAFLKYLYFQIIQLNTTNASEILYRDDNNSFHIKDTVKFYFVTGMPPCGDASIMPKTDSCTVDIESVGSVLTDQHDQLDTASNKLKRRNSHKDTCEKRPKVEHLKEKDDIHRTGAKCLPDSEIQDPHLSGILYHSIGAVRTKPGRGDPTLSLSCSDKIARWNAVGWQGALLSFFIEAPIFMEAIICGGNCPFSKKSFDRAVNERINRQECISIFQSNITFPDLKAEGKRPNPASIIWCDGCEKESEVSINGRKLGVTKKNLHKKTARTSICKKELLILFEKAVNSLEGKNEFLHKRIGENVTLKCLTYGELKMRAQKYQLTWKTIKETYFKVWSNKPADLLNFSLHEEEDLKSISSFSVTKMEGLKNIHDAVDHALTSGYRSFDCSPRNNEEENLGKALEELLPLHKLERKDIVLCSKVIPKNYGKYLTRESFSKSCENLKTDYIDIFFMEWPGGFKIDPESPENILIRAETWNEITSLISSGSIKTGGVCHFNKRHLESIRKKSRVLPSVNQVEFHPHCPQIELLKYCNERNIQLMAACHKDTINPMMLEEPVVKKLAEDLKKTPTQVVLKWILNKGVGVVVQSLNKHKIAENLELFDFILEKADMDVLNNIYTRERYLRSSVAVM